jgi:hypothetical protein
VWTAAFTADKLARLLVLREQVDAEKKVRAIAPSSRQNRGAAATPTPPMNDLKRAMKALFTAYDKSLTSYIEAKRAEANKSVRLPSLDRQLTGPLLQYDFQFNNRKKDNDGCPLCLHLSTMAVESQADVNAKNRELRRKASADGGDGKFMAVSAKHGCYCSLNNCRGHEKGYGCYECLRKAADGEKPVDRGPGTCGFECSVYACDCRCVFQENNRQKIATGAMREKRRQEELATMARNGATTSNVTPEESGRTAWTGYIMSAIENHSVREHQHADARSNDEILQDIASQAAMEAYSDPVLFSNPNVRRGLQSAGGDSVGEVGELSSRRWNDEEDDVRHGSGSRATSPGRGRGGEYRSHPSRIVFPAQQQYEQSYVSQQAQ